MSDDATQNLLGARLDQLVSLVKDLADKHTETDARIERVERVLEQRLYDTRPIWESVQADLREVRSLLQEVGERVGRLKSEATEMRSQITEMRVENSNGFRLVDRKIGVLGKTLIDMTADIRELQDRVEKIDSQPT
jgi:chromosome segregation ATPase